MSDEKPAPEPVTTASYVRRHRHIRGDLCAQCGGWGTYLYPDSGTWRDAGIVCHAFTPDVCDECWGSGDALHPGADLRKMEAAMEAEVRRRALTLWLDALGTEYAKGRGAWLRPAIERICILLETAAIRRRIDSPPPYYFNRLAKRLAEHIRGGLAESTQTK
jgi:hypothetical protein